jgi:hypothetical protein
MKSQPRHSKEEFARRGDAIYENVPDVFQGPCSLCLHTDRYEVTDGGKYKWFRCDSCKSFLISDFVEKEVAKASLV